MSKYLSLSVAALSVLMISGAAHASIISGEIDGSVEYRNQDLGAFTAKYTIDTAGKADVTFMSAFTRKAVLAGSATHAAAKFQAFDPDPVTGVQQQSAEVLFEGPIAVQPEKPGPISFPNPPKEPPPIQSLAKAKAPSLTYDLYLDPFAIIHDAQFYDVGAPYDLDLQTGTLSSVFGGGYLRITNSKGQQADFDLDVSRFTVTNIAYGADIDVQPSLSTVPLPGSAPLFGAALLAVAGFGSVRRAKQKAA